MSRRDKRASMREGPLSDLFRSTSEDAPADPPQASAPSEPVEETPPERLKRVFSEEPRQRREVEPVVEAPRYGREEPEYEPPGSGEPHQPVIRVVGVGGG